MNERRLVEARRHGVRSAEIAKRLAAAASAWRKDPTDEHAATLRSVSEKWDEAQRLHRITMGRHLKVVE